mmetsp:Transcript_8437/g.21654  ORF Transcript_8437/g.21654 Transcript_8437/m.21654 type:complete len:482 (-) Transcript_8437:208-1653(-)
MGASMPTSLLSPSSRTLNFNNFGFELDEDAQARWASIAATASPHCGSDAELELHVAARRVAQNLRFLKLTVLSRTELEWKMSRYILEHYSPLKQVPPTDKAALVAAAKAVVTASRALGAIVGNVVADALGAPFEFLHAVDVVGSSGSRLDPKTLKNFGAHNRFRLKPGQWTDDASMALCLLDSLLARGRYDGSDARVRFWNWWFRGYCNAFGKDSWRHSSVGLGKNVRKALYSMQPGVAPPPRYEALTTDSGNGALMRLAPVPVFYSSDIEMATRQSAESSFSTHPGVIAAAACAFLGFAIARAIRRPEADDSTPAVFLEATVADFIRTKDATCCPEIQRLLRSEEPDGPERCWNWRADQLQVEATLKARGGRYNGYPCSASYFGSYAVDGLAVALWSFYHSTNFLDAVSRSINILGDADSTAAICGQLAGAFFGYGAIDGRLIERLELWDDGDTVARAALLFATSVPAHLVDRASRFVMI